MTAIQIPDEAVQAAKKAVSERCKRTYLTSDQMFAALAAALPHLSAPCAVEVRSRAKRVASIHRKKDDGTVLGSFHKETAEVIEELLSCIVTKPVDVAAVREECAEVVENAVLSYHVADCAGLADWKAFEKGQESGLKFGAAAIRALSPTEPVGRATLAQEVGE